MEGERLSLFSQALLPRDRRKPLTFSADPLLVFGVCHALLFLACAYLFYKQGVGEFPGDTRWHAAFAFGEGDAALSAYSLLHIVIRAMAVCGSLAGMAETLETYVVLITVLLVGSTAATSLMLVSYFNRYRQTSPWLAGTAPLILVIVSMLIVPGWSNGALYIGIGTPNPWHNPTYIFARPFSIAVFLCALQATSDAVQKKRNWKNLFALSVFAILSMWAKPSFLMSFLPSIAIYCLWKCASTRCSLNSVLIIGCALLPSIIPLLSIESSMYGGAQRAQGGVYVVWGEVWRLHSSNVILSILIGMAFPLYTLAVFRSRISAAMALATVNFAIATLIYYFLAEKGERFTHANFSWGYLFGMFFMFYTSIETFIFRKCPGRTARAIGWLLLAWHAASGAYYLVKLLRGFDYL